MLKIGNNSIELLFGEIPVSKIMLGTALVYERPIIYEDLYLTFDIISGGTIGWKKYGSVGRTIYYSSNNGTTWNELVAGSNTVINVNTGDRILIKGTNTSYSTDKNNYSGFDGGTATYNIEGNIMSLVYGDNFRNLTTLTDQFTFCSIFKQSNAVSAENLILPTLTLADYCYRAMFSKAYNLVKAPKLPATTLSKGCYWYMFEECAITTAPDLLADVLAVESYGHMFEGCSNLNYVRCLATNRNASTCTVDWLKSVSATGTFIKHPQISWGTGVSSIPSGWNVINEVIS